MTAQIFKQVMRTYEKDREKAENTRQVRRDEIYSKIPRVKEIDEGILQTGIDLSRAVLSMDMSVIDGLKEKNVALTKEKEGLLKANKYPKDYLADVFLCSDCKDTGFIQTNRCKCLQQKLINEYYNMSGLTKILQTENFDNFDFRFFSNEKNETLGLSPKENMEDIYSVASKFSQNFQKQFTNFYFYGKQGLGKTFLCNCIAKDVLNKGHVVLYISAGELCKIIDEARFGKDGAGGINMFYEATLLIIDDLGTEFSTIVNQSEIFNIINSRLIYRKPTIISSNLSFKELEEKYSGRLVSRIYGEYEFFNFFGNDIRVLKKMNRI